MGKIPHIVGVAGRKARARLRRGILLDMAAVSASTRSRYFTAVSQVLPLVERADTMEDLDDLVSEWIQGQFSKGYPLNIVSDCLCGMHLFLPSTKRKLPASWKMFGTWRKIEIPSRAPPITSDLLFAMVGRALHEGELAFGCLLAVGFDCFLRTGELLTLTPACFLVNQETGIVRIPKSKGGTRRNITESVILEDARAKLLVGAVRDVALAKLEMNLPLWRNSGSAFRNHFGRYLKYFQVEHLNFRCYSLRRGGATAFFAHTGSLERTLLRGRWSSLSVARIYLWDALAQLPKLKARTRTIKLIDKFLPLLSPH